MREIEREDRERLDRERLDRERLDREPGDRVTAWARLRFSVVGPLLAAPPARGELRAEIAKLAEKLWRRPGREAPGRFGRSTIERWYYAAKNAARDPVKALGRRPRKDLGTAPSLSAPAAQALRAQYAAHPGWSYRLHADNLRAVPELGPIPSTATLRRWMKRAGLVRVRRRRPPRTPGEAAAERRLVEREVRSYEAEYVHGLWHSDFHVARRKVATRDGRWVVPQLFASLDDRSRLCCHVQWYLEEEAETFVHGFSQALMKRGLPRSVLTDNGGAETAAEVEEGLHELGIWHPTILPHSPYQNAKQEVFWAAVEGRLMSMLESVEDLTLDVLNEATQAWAEMEYNRALHSEIGTTPLARFLSDRSVGRESPSPDALARAFRAKLARRQRQSDGTISLFGRRFEVPGRYRHFERVVVRAARWNLTVVDAVDERTGAVLCALHPLDKTRNADGRRRRLEDVSAASTDACGPAAAAGEPAPLLKKLLADYAATGLPPAYLPHVKEER